MCTQFTKITSNTNNHPIQNSPISKTFQLFSFIEIKSNQPFIVFSNNLIKFAIFSFSKINELILVNIITIYKSFGDLTKHDLNALFHQII